MRADSLAKKLQNNNHYEFWKEIRVMNNCKSSSPTNIEGACSPEEIVVVWHDHYFKLFNCIKSNVVVVDNVDVSDNMMVRSNDASDAIMMLDNHKACGIDYITAEHLKNASPRLCPLLAMCFTGLLVHGILPDSITSVLLVPVIKDKVGKINSIDNYRPIALASILSKVLERILLTRLEMFVLTTDNQFGFKRKHGTDTMCIHALK